MWSAFMNGSGVQSGGGGYVPSQGWEFVPCSRMDRADRDRGKGRSPLRRISSPPTVFSHFYDSQFGLSPGLGERESGTQLEHLGGQMWPGPDPQPPQQQQQQQQSPPQQTHHTRLKKKFEDLKKRHVQDKEGWMREKESLLREVADIQGGENRRILLDLKTVLDEVQLEVKREEEKRSDLQLQYTRDRCAWELEKAELKCRIAQLEAREGAGLISGGVQSAAAGPCSVVSRSAGEQHGETSTFRREREEQRRLLADTHSAAMDLRCRLEHNERDWSREKAELLDKFDMERREWESQLKDMQKKIEELYCEVKTKREGSGLSSRRQNHNIGHRLSIHSTSTGSSLLSDNSHSSSQSEPVRLLPGFGHNGNDSGCVGPASQHATWFEADGSCEYNNAGGQFTRNDLSHLELVDELRSRGTWQQHPATESKEAVDTTDLDGVFHGAPGCEEPQTNVSKDTEKNVPVSPQESPLWSEWSHGTDKKKNTTTLNAALKEIARVSEELCSYQDEIRKKSSDWRNQFESESLCLPEESKILFDYDKIRLEVEEPPCDLSQIYNDLRALERENWITLSPDNTWRAKRGLNKSQMENADLDRETPTSSGELSETDSSAPPIPPRISSWNLSSPTHTDTELHIPESPMTTVRKCHSPCVLVTKCSSPSIVRKFGAMLQENEGKVLIDGVVTSCAVPTSPKCNVGCCHNRWSCDTSKFTNTKMSAQGTVQKSFSEVNILTAGKDCSLGVGDLKVPPIVKELPVDLLLSSLEISPSIQKLQGSKRNIMLEQKTAEFNRTLFQAEMGRDVKEHDSSTITDPSANCSSDEAVFPPHCADVTAGVTLSVSTPDSTIDGVQPSRTRCGPEGHEVRMNVSPEQPLIGLREGTTTSSQRPAHHSEVKHTIQTASSPSRKTHRAATEALISEPALPVNTQPGQNVDGSSSRNENPSGAKPQPGRVGVSLLQPCAENKQRQLTQPRHVSAPPSQSESSRPGPRIMNDHPWKPLTLAAYPRREGSRSNYGAVERILKNYESAARAQQSQMQLDEMSSSLNISVRKEETVTELDMLDMDPLPFPPSLTQTHAQLSSHSSTSVKEILRTVQEDSSVSSSSVHKNFSRPARPANRRLPSRWASRSPTSSSSTSSSSPSTTPVVPPSFSLQKHTSSFTYSHAFHIETVII